MGHPGSQQSDGAELVSLRQLRFQRDALGDVVDQNDAAHRNKIPRQQRRDCDVGGALLACAGGQRELIKVMNALLVAEALQRLDELHREDSTQFLADSLRAAKRVHGLHLRIPAFDAVVQVQRQDAHIDRFDNVFVEFFEPLEFADFFFQPRVEAGVLQSDADVAGQRFQQFHILAGKKIAADGPAQTNDGDSPAGCSVLDSTGQIVVQVQQCGGALLAVGQMHRLLRVLQENVRVVRCLVKVQETQVHADLRVERLGG